MNLRDTNNPRVMNSNRREGILWTPSQHPPHPLSLTTQSSHLFQRVLSAMKSGTAKEQTMPSLSALPPPPRQVATTQKIPYVIGNIPRWNVKSGDSGSFNDNKIYGPEDSDSTDGGHIAGDQLEVCYHHNSSGRQNVTTDVKGFPSMMHKKKVKPPESTNIEPGYFHQKDAQESGNRTVTQAASLHYDFLKKMDSKSSVRSAPPPRQGATTQKIPYVIGNIPQWNVKSSDSGPFNDNKIDEEVTSEVKLGEIKEILANAKEVATTLLYTDGSTQLRRKPVRRQSSEGTLKACSIYVAFPVENPGTAQTRPVLHYANLPLASSNPKIHTQCRDILLSLMTEARVITYKGQELVSAILYSFHDIPPSIWRKWAPMDTSLGAWLLNPDHTPGSFSELLTRYGMEQMTLPTTMGVDKGDQLALRHDLALLGPLMVKIYKKLQEEGLIFIFLKMETRLISLLAAMEKAGLKVSCSKLLQYRDLLKKKIAKVEAVAHKAAGRSFPINSTAQLREILFDELHLDSNKNFSKTQVHHHKSTSEPVLNQLCDLHPLPKAVLEYRHLCKINATYVTGIAPYITEGILKPMWLHMNATTGRLASCNPNIQGFPKHPVKLGVVQEQFIVGKDPVEVEVNVREAIESRPGFTFLAADYKSIELRVLAHLSLDPQLISVFTSSTAKTSDIFVSLTSEWYGSNISQVLPSERERTKHVVYAVIYGIGKEKLGEILNESPAVAKELISSFLTKFPRVRKYIDAVIIEARLKGVLSTICGRKRWFPQISSPCPHTKAHVERQAVNFPVQGSAADICKLGMIEVIKMLAEDSPRSRLLVQIHDELLFEVPDEEVSEISDKVKHLMESASTLPCKLKVPLRVKMSAGKTWAALAPIID